MNNNIFITGVIILGTAMLVPAKSTFAQENKKSASLPATVMETPASAKGLTTFNIQEKGKEYIIIRDKDKIVHFLIGHKRIPEAEQSAYADVIKKLDRQTRKGIQDMENMKGPDMPPPPPDHSPATPSGDKQPTSDRKQEKVAAPMNPDEALAREVINDLIKEGVLENSQSLAAFVLTDDVMIVNRRQLTDPVRDRFKAKYLKSPGDMVHLSLSNFK